MAWKLPLDSLQSSHRVNYCSPSVSYYCQQPRLDRTLHWRARHFLALVNKCQRGPRAISVASDVSKATVLSEGPTTPTVTSVKTPILLVLVGVPGSGKTTFAQRLARDSLQSWFIVNQDAMKGSSSLATCITAAEKALKSGSNCIIDRTNVSADERQRLLSSLQGLMGSSHVVFLDLPYSVCRDRASRRVDHPTVTAEDGPKVVSISSALLSKNGHPSPSEGFTSVMRCFSDQDADVALTAWMNCYIQDPWQYWDQHVTKSKPWTSAVKVGDVVDAKVVRVMEYGAIVKCRHGVGMVHKANISSYKVTSAPDIFDVEENIQAVVKEVDSQGRITLATKDLELYPGDMLRDKKMVYARAALLGQELKVRGVATGLILAVNPTFALVDVGDTIALLHRAGITGASLRSVDQVFVVGETIKALVQDVQASTGRVILSTRRLESYPGEILEDKEKVLKRADWWQQELEDGQICQGVVNGISDFGVFVTVGQNTTALLHRSAISEDPSIDISSLFKPGDDIQARVQKTDDGRINLETKSLERVKGEMVRHKERVFRRASILSQQIKVGHIITGYVVNVEHFGVFVDIGPVVALLPRICISQKEVEKDSINRIFSLDDEIKAYVMYIDRTYAEGDSSDPANWRVTIGTKKLENTAGEMIRDKTRVFDRVRHGGIKRLSSLKF